MTYRDAGAAGRAAIAAAIAGGADGNDLRVLCAVLSVTALYSRPNYLLPRDRVARLAGLDGAHADRIVRRSLARLHAMGAIVRIAGPGRTPLIGLPPTGQGDPRCDELAGDEQPDKGTPVEPDKGTPVAAPPTRAQVNSAEEDLLGGPYAVAAAAPPARTGAGAREAAAGGRRHDVNHAAEEATITGEARAAAEAIAAVTAVAARPPTTRQLLGHVIGPWREHPLGVQATALRVRMEYDMAPELMPRPLGVLFRRLRDGDHLRDRLPWSAPAEAEAEAEREAAPEVVDLQAVREALAAAPFARHEPAHGAHRPADPQPPARIPGPPRGGAVQTGAGGACADPPPAPGPALMAERARAWLDARRRRP